MLSCWLSVNALWYRTAYGQYYVYFNELSLQLVLLSVNKSVYMKFADQP